MVMSVVLFNLLHHFWNTLKNGLKRLTEEDYSLYQMRHADFLSLGASY